MFMNVKMHAFKLCNIMLVILNINVTLPFVVNINIKEIPINKQLYIR